MSEDTKKALNGSLATNVKGLKKIFYVFYYSTGVNLGGRVNDAIEEENN